MILRNSGVAHFWPNVYENRKFRPKIYEAQVIVFFFDRSMLDKGNARINDRIWCVAIMIFFVAPVAAAIRVVQSPAPGTTPSLL